MALAFPTCWLPALKALHATACDVVTSVPALLRQAMGTDFWVVVQIASTTRGEHLEGTRLTLVRLVDQPDAFELSIRTPVTPHRWQAFNKVSHSSCCQHLRDCALLRSQASPLPAAS